jgi:excisionase family DNA binding protein
MTLNEAAAELGVHYMTVYRYVRTGRLPALKLEHDWQVDPADLDLVRRNPDTQNVNRPTRATGIAKSRAGMENLLLSGDEAGAWNLVEEALASGASPDIVLLDIIAPSLHSIGERWAQNDLSIAHEHLAAAVALRLISRLGARFTPRGRKRGAVLLAAPSGDRHGLPIAIVANLLRWRGFTVVELGADVPPQELAEIASKTPGLVAVGLACTFPEAVTGARHAIAALRAGLGTVSVFIGGRAVVDATVARDAGADYYTGTSGREVLRVLDELTGLTTTAT